MNSTEDTGLILYYALNGYGVTIQYLIITLIIIIIGLTILFLNFLVIDTFRLKREQSEVFLVSLAMSDFTTGLLVLHTSVYQLINFQNVLECKFRFGMLLTVALCSGYHLLLLTVDRYIKITCPLQYNTFCKRSSYLATCISMWMFAVLVGLVPTFGWKNTTEETDGDEILCSFFGTFHKDYLRLVVVLFLTPAILMLILYGLIFRVAHKHSKQIAIQQQVINHQNINKNNKLSWKFTKTISIIVGTYVILWLPTGIYVSLVAEGVFKDKSNSEKGEILSYTASIAFLNSLLDPIIYAFQISSVKQRFRRVFCCNTKNLSNIQAEGYITDVSSIKIRN